VSSYKVILEVSKLLQATLWNGFASDNALTQYVASQDAIVLVNPADAASQGNYKVSLWLYQVQQNEFLRNQPPLRVPQRDDEIQFQPLVLNLYYLLTPSTESVEGDQMVLGRSMQIFNDNAILLLQSQEDPGVSQELRLSMCQRDLRELAEVWEALQQPYRLSVCYEIRVTQIESARRERTGRVRERANAFQNLQQAAG
jgi:Pvc16 N-terminal domain